MDTFVLLEKGIDKTVESFNQANSSYYKAIEKAAAINPESYDAIYKKPLEVKRFANDVTDLISVHKIQLISLGDLKSIADAAGRIADFSDEHGIPLHKDNQDYGAYFYMTDKGGANGTALALAVDKFSGKIVKVVEEDGDPTNDYLIEQYRKLLDTTDHTDHTDPRDQEDPLVTFAKRISEH